jgi:DNA-binding FadR family transcriptional regulator
MFKKANRPIRIYQEIADQIEEAILLDKLQVGERLPSERSLSETFDVSRRTLRESLRVIEQKGLIEIRTTGAIVKLATREKLSQSLALAIKSQKIAWHDIAQFRSEVEGNIAFRAAHQAKKEDIEELEKIIRLAEKHLEPGCLVWDEYINLDKRIHIILSKIGGNQIYELIMRTFLDNLPSYFEPYRTRETEFVQENLENMKALVKAVKKKDGEAARKLLNEHLDLGTYYRNEALK